MAEVTTQQTAQPVAGQVAGQQAAAPAATDAKAPWAEKFKAPEEVWTAYKELESRFGKQGDDYGRVKAESQQYAERLNAWQDWYKKNLEPHWDKVVAYLQNGGQPAQAPQAQQPTQPAQPQQDWAADWETLRPQEQVKRLQEAAVAQAVQSLTPALSKWQQTILEQQQQANQALQKQLQEKEQYYDNYLNLYRTVMDMRMKDPTVDVDKVLEQSVQFLQQQKDPKTLLEIGRKLAYSDVDVQKRIDAALAQGKQDWEQEQRNKDLAAVQPMNGSPPAFKVKVGGAGGPGTQRENAAKALAEKYGPQIFHESIPWKGTAGT